MHWGGVFVCERERSFWMGVGVTEQSIPARTLKACGHASSRCLPPELEFCQGQLEGTDRCKPQSSDGNFLLTYHIN